MSEPAASSLNGNLRLVCACDPQRGSYLAEQSFSAPVHVSKAYWDGAILLVNVINPTAGIFGGDTVRTHVIVEPGARVLLSSPSATRFHSSRGRESCLEQTFQIASGGSLDVFPEISIPQRDSRSFQKTTIQVEPGGELVYLEALAPGRVASGESFAFARYSWATDIRVGERLVHRERATLEPGRPESLAALRALFPVTYHAGIVVIAPGSESWKSDFAETLSASANNPQLRIAASRLTAHGWSIRLLAGDSLALHEGLQMVREQIYQRMGRLVPEARRTR